jgi:hypothetical protein
MVLEAGLEPARNYAGDFKSPVATYYTTRAKIIGGGPENRTLVVTIRARERRSPLLPPITILKYTTCYAGHYHLPRSCAPSSSLCNTLQ